MVYFIKKKDSGRGEKEMMEEVTKFKNQVVCRCGKNAVLAPPRFYWKVVSGEELEFRCPECYKQCLDCECQKK